MHVWSPSWNMPSDNLILFEADIRPYGSRKLKDGWSKQSSERKGRKGGGRMVKTHFGNLASPPLLLWIPTGSNEGGFAEVNHFLQVMNSQGRQDESGVCSDQVEASQQHFGRQSCCFSLTLVLKCWKIWVFEVPIRQTHRILHGSRWRWMKSFSPVTLMMSLCEMRQIGGEKFH